MNPTLNKILQKFSTQKVNLGVLQNLESQINKGKSLIKEAQDRTEQARDAVNRAYNIAEDDLNDIIIKAENIANDLKGAFKDLDSPLSSKAKKAIKELEDLEKTQRKLISDIKNVI